MPPIPGQKKKKGPAPAHQNKFAFHHNPKSKTTAKILASPNIHVCRRCHDKIEWRKQYRKYKPRTQPGTCNGCLKRNVKAAYHTICESCTRNSVKAKELITAVSATGQEETVVDTPEEGEPQNQTTSLDLKKLRACAVCVKEIALPDPDGDDEEETDLAEKAGRILRLREIKTLERQAEREAREAREARKAKRMQSSTEDNDNESNEDNTESDAESIGEYDDEDDEEDPFLKAVGGADKLLTGKAYQEKLLAEQRLLQQQRES